MNTTSSFLVRSLAPCAIAGAALAQVQVGWSTLVGSGSALPQWVSASAVDGAGATFVAGARDHDPRGALLLDAVLAKVDAQGGIAWVRSYDEPTGGSQSFEHVGVDAAGNVVVAGTTAAMNRALVARYDTDGNQLWLRTFAALPGAGTGVQAMAVAPSGDIVLVGSVQSTPQYGDAFVARLQPDGTTAWTRTLDGTAHTNDGAFDVVLDPAGNAFVTGQTGTPTEYVYGLLAAKLAFDGTIAWHTEFVPPATAHHHRPRAAVDAQGRMYVADHLLVNNNKFLGLVQFDANGALVWDRRVPADAGASVAGIHVRSDDTVVVGAQFGSASLDAAEGFVGAWDAAGSALWSTTYAAPGAYHESVTDFVPDPVGGAILSGWHGTDIGARVLFLAHVTATGQRDWTQLLGSGSTGESIPHVHAAADDSLRVTSTWDGGGQDYRMHVRRLEHDVTAFCSGDGSATACPCGNFGGPRSGCASSLGVGAELTASGSASLSFDTLLLRCAQLPATTVLFFQGTDRVAGGLGSVFGDGLRCAGGTVIRLGTFIAGGPPVYFPVTVPSVSVVGHVTSPGLRAYQCWYRNSASFCTPETFNTSNGLAVLWRP